MATENTQITKVKKDISASVLAKINAFRESGELNLPTDYSPENALKSAYLVLSETVDRDKKPVLESCSPESIANSLLKMVVYGLSPLKQQVYFVPYGGKLECTVAYTGNIAMAKRSAGLVDIKSNLIMDGDEFDFKINPSTGRKEIVNHKQTLESIGSKKILGAYAVYSTSDGQTDVDIMNWEQIETSWKQGASKGNSPAHTKFAGEMGKRTVINRAIKILLRSSDDSILYDGIDKEDIDVVKEDVKHKIETEGNAKVIDIDDAVVVEDNAPEVKKQVEGKQDPLF